MSTWRWTRVLLRTMDSRTATRNYRDPPLVILCIGSLLLCIFSCPCDVLSSRLVADSAKEMRQVGVWIVIELRIITNFNLHRCLL